MKSIFYLDSSLYICVRVLCVYATILHRKPITIYCFLAFNRVINNKFINLLLKGVFNDKLQTLVSTR